MTQNFSSVYHFCKTGSGHPDSYRDLQPRQPYHSPGLAKIAPPTLSAHTHWPLAVSLKIEINKKAK
jgi:hypothetical protein